MIKKIVCETAIDYEYPPDGEKVPVIDAYDGCQLHCPYCFQWKDETWNRDILVKTNLPEILAQELTGWDTTQALYVGSRSDPYMALERKYRLTRRTLQVLRAHNVPCFLSTKSNKAAFFDDIDLFLEYKEKLVICVGQANMAHLRQVKDQRELPNIHTVNKLMQLGITTWVFITPVLPGIMDVEMMIAALPKDVPIFIDKLRLDKGCAYEQRFFEYLGTHYPELKARYRLLMQEGTDPYYEKLDEMYQDDERIKFVFGDR